MYGISIKLFLIIFKYIFFSLTLIFLLGSCSILEYKKDKNDLKFSQNEYKKNKCPITKIPYETTRYISNKKYVLSIKKIEMACKRNLVSKSDLLDIVIQYKVKMEFKTNRALKVKDLKLPSIFIAIVDRDSEAVLAKMKSIVEVSDKEDNFIINKNKFRFKYKSYESLSIYFGLQ